MQENADQNNSEYGHFLRSEGSCLIPTILEKVEKEDLNTIKLLNMFVYDSYLLQWRFKVFKALVMYHLRSLFINNIVIYVGNDVNGTGARVCGRRENMTDVLVAHVSHNKRIEGQLLT